MSGPNRCMNHPDQPRHRRDRPVNLYAVLPEGFEYVQGSDGAAFSATNRAIVWKLSGLAPAGTKTVTLKLRCDRGRPMGCCATIAQTTPEQPTVGAGGVSVAAKSARPRAGSQGRDVRSRPRALRPFASR